MIPPLWLEDPNLPWFKPNRFSFSIPSQSYQYPANDISISSDIHFTNLVAGFKPEKYARQWRPSSSERWKREHHSNDPPDHHWLHTHYVRWWNHHFWWLTSTFFHFWISTSPALHCPNKFLPPFEDLLPCGYFGIFFAQFDITMIWRTESEWRQPFYKRFFPEKNMGPDEPSGKIISNLVVYHDFPPIFCSFRDFLDFRDNFFWISWGCMVFEKNITFLLKLPFWVFRGFGRLRPMSTLVFSSK